MDPVNATIEYQTEKYWVDFANHDREARQRQQVAGDLALMHTLNMQAELQAAGLPIIDTDTGEVW